MLKAFCESSSILSLLVLLFLQLVVVVMECNSFSVFKPFFEGGYLCYFLVHRSINLCKPYR